MSQEYFPNRIDRRLATTYLGLGLAACLSGRAQAESAEVWRIENIAGTGVAGFQGEKGPALSAQLDDPFGVVRGPDGDIWFCEYTGQRVRKIRSDGTLETIVGTGQKGYTGDRGAALEATMNLPHEIRFDSAGDLYIVDMQNHAIRKVELATMRITTIAGTGSPGYSGDGGPAIEAKFKQPHSIQFGPEGDLYVCDIGNHAIRRIDIKTQKISTYAGTGVPGPTPDGAPLSATPLNGPRSIDFDQQGDLWLATREGNQVFRIDRKQGRYEHVAGTGQNGLAGDGGPAKLAKLKGPKGIALDGQGRVWLADTESHCVRRIDTNTGLIERIAGTGIQGDGPVGDPLECKLARLHGIFVDRDGSILIGDSQAHRIRRLYREK